MVGVNAAGEIQGVEILKQLETPGLGARITEPGFRQGFAGRNIADTDWRVRKDGGDIDQITAATISSRAVVEAVKAGVEVFKRNEEQIRNTR